MDMLGVLNANQTSMCLNPLEKGMVDTVKQV